MKKKVSNFWEKVSNLYEKGISLFKEICKVRTVLPSLVVGSRIGCKIFGWGCSLGWAGSSDLASDARSLAGAGPGSGVGSSDLLAEMNDPISGTSTQF